MPGPVVVVVGGVLDAPGAEGAGREGVESGSFPREVGSRELSLCSGDCAGSGLRAILPTLRALGDSVVAVFQKPAGIVSGL